MLLVINVLSLIILIGLIVLFAWLVKRAWGSKRAWLKWPGLVLSGLLTAALVLVLGVALKGYYNVFFPVSRAVSDVKVEGTPAQIARGQQIASICTGCHSPDGKLPLAGSKENMAQVPGLGEIGKIYAPNLTPGGELASWSDGEILRAMREGIHKSGRPLVIMPSQALHNLSDEDAYALVAFLRSQPAVKRDANWDAPANGVNLLGAVMLTAFGVSNSVQEPITAPVVAPPRGTSAEYGEYLTRSLGCRDCHGEKLTGGAGGFGPAAPNLTVVVPKWSEADVVRVFREGKLPDGSAVNTMPWKEYTGALSDDDLKAIYNYLHGLTPEQLSK